MHRFLWAILAFTFLVNLRGAVVVGDSYDQVIEEKGQPTGKLQAGDRMILRYHDETIRLKAGKVAAIESAAESAAKAAGSSVESHVQAAAVVVPLSSDGHLAWTNNYRAALAAAKQQNRHVFVFFTGSDWCGWCMKLNKEILSTSEFAQYAQENLVLVEVDFPHTKFQSEALKQQNDTLQRAFQITGYPTVVVLNSDARPVGILGYQEGGPGPFIKRLKAM